MANCNLSETGHNKVEGAVWESWRGPENDSGLTNNFHFSFYTLACPIIVYKYLLVEACVV